MIHFVATAVGLGLLSGLVTAAWAVAPLIAPPTLVFGVSIPTDHRGDQRLTQVRRQYLWRVVTLGFAIWLVSVLAAKFWGFGSGAAVGITGAAFGGFVSSAMAHRAIGAICDTGHWHPSRPTRIAAWIGPTNRSTKAETWGHLLATGGFLIATIAASIADYSQMPRILPLHYSLWGKPLVWTPKTPAVVAWLTLLPVVSTLVLVIAGHHLAHVRRHLDPDQLGASNERQQVFVLRNQRLLAWMGLFVAYSGWLNDYRRWHLLSMSPTLATALWLIPLGALIVYSAILMVATGQFGSRSSGLRGPDNAYREDDRHWVAGQFYMNAADPALLVPKRFGYGYTFNWGRSEIWLCVVVLLTAYLWIRP
ncbi:DUF5808 domain-containing protein [Sulfobacillus harzensis]|jgi:uncharacterized membrane protein|uniref:DUF5808 domain-containing protein n=1 Tax=Sulfobacillus harzensis TaxID=2729629 RepID=A0A7Y0L8C7_9FIRM|nr:DUF5808 domain-containing protein [Sulfobacillus harzensis]NMP24330.1 hypothetical protein [Sulfobacillus harzensis]